MTNKEKLEIIEKKLNVLYVKLENLHASEVQKNITQAIYNLESTKLLLEEIDCQPQKIIGFDIKGNNNEKI